MSSQSDAGRNDAARSSSRGLQRILVATDGSPAAADATALAADLAKAHGSELIIVHVVPLVDVVSAPDLAEIGPVVLHEPTPHDHELLHEAAAIASVQGVVATTALLPGSAAEAIVAYSESSDADLVVVGSHGHRAVLGGLHGSVAREVLDKSKRSVLVVRG